MMVGFIQIRHVRGKNSILTASAESIKGAKE
jgi:hypothetical protein